MTPDEMEPTDDEIDSDDQPSRLTPLARESLARAREFLGRPAKKPA